MLFSIVSKFINISKILYKCLDLDDTIQYAEGEKDFFLSLLVCQLTMFLWGFFFENKILIYKICHDMLLNLLRRLRGSSSS